MDLLCQAKLMNRDAIKKRYAQRYRWQMRLFRVIDSVLAPFALSRTPRLLASKLSPKKILIANAGHLGDWVIASAAIESIRAKWPHAQIDLLGGESLKTIAPHLAGITNYYYLEHWKTDRSHQSFLSKWRRYRQDARAVIAQIRAQKYDLAIDLRIWFPNFVPLLWRTNIPIRIGSSRLGFSALLSYAAPFDFKSSHESTYHLDLLNSFANSQNPPLAAFAPSQPQLLASPANQNLRLIQWFARHGILPGTPYRVIHMGSSNSAKDWPIERWQALALRLAELHQPIIFTGLGPKEHTAIERMLANFSFGINAANELEFAQLLSLLEGAQLVYSVETSIGHLAAALGTPVVTISSGIANPEQWRPMGASAVVTGSVSCAPCFIKGGCATMACIREVSVEQVQTAAQTVLSEHAGTKQDIQ
jgi:ADP-heptose:LPS heptosyltransferase